MTIFRTAALLALASLPGMAQSPFEMNVSLLTGIQDMNRLSSSNDLVGTSLAFGLRLEIKPGLSHRIHLGALGIKSKPETGMGSSSPRHIHFGWDVMQELSPKWTAFGGLTGTKWKHEETNNARFSDRGIDYPQGSTTVRYTNNSPKGTKLGARLGLEYNFSANLKGTISFSQSEFNKLYNPGWFSWGVTYRF
jgi:hypothetical protein